MPGPFDAGPDGQDGQRPVLLARGQMDRRDHQETWRRGDTTNADIRANGGST